MFHWELWGTVEDLKTPKPLQWCEMIRPQPISISAVYTDRKSLPPGGGRDFLAFHATFHELFIPSKHHLGNFIGADVSKEPGVYHLRESCLVKVHNSADFLCELHCGSCWCQKPMKNHHRQPQKRFLTPHHELSTVLTTSHPDTSMSVPLPGHKILPGAQETGVGLIPAEMSSKHFRDQVLVWMWRAGKRFLGNTNTDLFQKAPHVLYK